MLSAYNQSSKFQANVLSPSRLIDIIQSTSTVLRVAKGNNETPITIKADAGVELTPASLSITSHDADYLSQLVGAIYEERAPHYQTLLTVQDPRPL